MIVRILGEGQLELADSAAEELNKLDNALEKAVTAGDEQAFRATLSALLERVRALGTPVPGDELAPSEFILPYAEAHIEDVRRMLSDDGLIPG
jgi:hypothetical protein